MGKLILYIVLGLIAVFHYRYKGFRGSTHWVCLRIALPVIVVGAIGFVIYKVATKDKALPGSGKFLP
ncbi:MAG: hypothetical protein R2688_07225 [Fimbriimonadaceae bacterium]